MAITHSDAKYTDIIAEMDLTPLVGIILLVLLIFMFELPTKKHMVSLAQAANYGCDGLRELEQIEIDFDGVITWQGQNLNEAELRLKLQQYVSDSGVTGVILHPNRLSKYDEFARVIAIAKQSGIVSLILVADTPFLK